MNIQAITDFVVGNAPSKSDPVAPANPPAERKQETSQIRVVTAEQPQARDNADEAPDKGEVEQVLDSINTFLKTGDNHIQFAMHQKAQRLMVEVIDNETQEVIRTFPPKELLDLAARIGEMVGTLIDQTG